MVICLEQGADLHTAQLMPLPLTVYCFSKIQIGFTFLVLAHPGSPEERAVKRVCVCVSFTHFTLTVTDSFEQGCGLMYVGTGTDRVCGMGMRINVHPCAAL